MPTQQDIREWAEENQIDLIDGKITADVRKQFLQAQSNGGIVERENKTDSIPVERAPKIPKPSPVESIKNAVRKVNAPNAKRATTRHARISVDKVVGRLWGMLGQVVQPINLPVARVLAMQAPVAGQIIEDVVANTVADKVLQPIARWEERGELAFALIGPPIIVATLTTKPQLAPVLVPMLRDALRTWIVIAGPKLEKIKKQEEDFKKEYGVEIDNLIAMLLSAPEQTAENAAE